MLSLQSFLREGRVVGPCWEKIKPKGPKGTSEVPEHLKSALCAPPGPRVARLGSRPFLGALVSSSSQHTRTLELVLQECHASFRTTSVSPLQRIAAETGKRVSLIGHMS